MRGGYSTTEMLAHRNRCRVAHVALDDASLIQYTVSTRLRGVAASCTLYWGSSEFFNVCFRIFVIIYLLLYNIFIIFFVLCIIYLCLVFYYYGSFVFYHFTVYLFLKITTISFLLIFLFLIQCKLSVRVLNTG